MIINGLHLSNFRNHINTELSFSDNINVIYGNNGAGKTSILEAISVCSISRSFVPHSDVALINKNAKTYTVAANCTNDFDVPYKISVSFSQHNRKQISSNIGNNLLPKDIIGEMPLIVLSPDHKDITSGSPEFRRQFVNTILSQSSKYYLEKLFEIRKILKHRNIILQKLQNNLDCISEFEHWTDFFINANIEIILRRNDFISEFNPLFVEAYRYVSESKEEVNLSYIPNSISTKLLNDANKEQIKEELILKSRQLQNSEIKRATTLFGCQKDEFRIVINDGSAREFASQGQHKSLLIALKFAEFRYLLEKRKETPIILFDDIFSELDSRRVKKVLDMLLESSSQIFITLTEPSLIDIDKKLHKTFINIEDGKNIENDKQIV